VSSKTEEPKDHEPEYGPVITHFPLQAVETVRPVLPEQEEEKEKWQMSFKAGQRTAFVFLIISLMCFFILLVNHSRLKVSNPVHNLQLKQLKEDVGNNIVLIENSEDNDYIEKMKAHNVLIIQQIRELDLSLREYYFDLKAKERTGAWVLFFSLVGFFWSIRSTTVFKPETPTPSPDFEKGDEQLREKRLGRNALVVLSVVLVGSTVLIYFIEKEGPGTIYNKVVGAKKSQGPVNTLYTMEEFSKHWPWLGSASSNPVYDVKLPTEFDTKGKNLKWKAPIPMGGASAPIYWGNQLYLTAANKTKRAVYCFDANSGKQKWSTGVRSDKEKGVPEVFEDYVLAGSTPATDGNRVYSIFANGDLIAVDMKGKIVWQKDLGIPENDFGHASSLSIYDNSVIVQWDHSADEGSAIYVFDGVTGEEKVKIDRTEFGSIWRTPLVYDDGEVIQMISSAEKLMSHNFHTGELLWELHGIEGEIGSSPVHVDGIIYTLVNDMFGALKTKGNKVETVWETEDLAIPDIPNPIIKGDRVYTLDSGGVFTCLNLQTGEFIYEHEFNTECYASPVIFGDMVVCCSVEGDCFIVKTGDTFELVAENKLHVPVHATPVIYRNSLIIRSEKELFAFSL